MGEVPLYLQRPRTNPPRDGALLADLVTRSMRVQGSLDHEVQHAVSADSRLKPVSLESPYERCGTFRVGPVQRFLAHTKPPPHRTLQQDHAYAPRGVLGGWTFFCGRGISAEGERFFKEGNSGPYNFFFYIAIFGVRRCWELEEPERPEGPLEVRAWRPCW